MELPKVPQVPRLSGPMPRLIVFAVCAIVGVGLIALWWGQLQHVGKVERRLALAEQAQSETQAVNQSLARRNSELEEKAREVRGQLTGLQEQISTASATLDRSQLSYEELEDRYEMLNLSRTKIRVKTTQLTRDLEMAREQLEQTMREKSDLELALSRMREKMNLVDRDYRDAVVRLEALKHRPHPGVSVVSSAEAATMVATSSSALRPLPTLIPGTVELPPIIVRKNRAGMTLAVRGKVVEHNDAYNFVVIDQGSMDGVQVGMFLDIMRGSQRVGRAKVVRVRPKLAACDLIRSHTPGPVQMGDTVVQRGR